MKGRSVPPRGGQPRRCAARVLSDVGLGSADIDWVVPHQCRILDATARKLGLPPEKVIVTVDRHANVRRSVPLALDVAVRDGRIKRGDLWCLRRWVVALLGVRRRSAIESKENLPKLNCGARGFAIA